jgi:hypothetical protein
MSFRTFTVFQDAVSSEEPQAKITRPNAMVTRPSSLNLITSSNTTGSLNDLVALDKENFHPVTGERAGPSNNASSKKRKTGVLATKVQPLSTSRKDAQPEMKKRRASTSTSTKGKVKRDGKATATARKAASKRIISRKVSPMPRLNEEEEAQKDRITQVNIDSRCYELTVQPLADVSQAYEEGAAFEGVLTSSCEAKLKFCATKVCFHIIQLEYHNVLIIYIISLPPPSLKSATTLSHLRLCFPHPLLVSLPCPKKYPKVDPSLLRSENKSILRSLSPLPPPAAVA